jgi:virulence-associated protein VagC
MKEFGSISAKLFWSGGSQAVRLPREVRLPGSEVRIERRGKNLLVSPLEDGDTWGNFWERLVPLKQPVRRWKTKRAEKRRPV